MAVSSSRFVLTLGCALLVPISACTLLVDTSGLAGSEGDSAAPGDAEAGREATVDSSATVDGSDAAQDVVVEGGCASSTATFCDDFTGNDSLKPPTWSRVDPVDDAGILLSLTTSAYVSAPSAASFVVTSSAPGCSYLRLSRDFPGAHSRISAHLAVRTENSEYLFAMSAGSSSPGSRYQAIVLLDTSSGGTVRLQKISGSTTTEVGSARSEFAGSGLGRWVIIDVEYIEAAGVLKVTMDGVDATPISLPSDFVLENPSVSVGPFCTGGPITMLADDVSVNVIP